MPFDGMSESKMGGDGSYKTAQGTDDLKGVDGVSLSLPADTDGLSDYQEGDECDITIKGRVGAADQDGNIPVEVINLDLKPMSSGAKMYRRDQKNDMPPPETLGKGDEGDM